MCFLLAGVREQLMIFLQKYPVRFFCLKLKISITIEPIGFSLPGDLQIDPLMVLGYFIYLDLRIV